MSRNVEILENILGAHHELTEPQSRVEAILQAILNSSEYSAQAQSRIEEILLAIKNKGSYTEEPRSRNEAILISKLQGEIFDGDTFSEIEDLLKQWTELDVTVLTDNQQNAIDTGDSVVVVG